jgi:hypothetical protein
MGINICRVYENNNSEGVLLGKFIALLESESNPFTMQIANNLIILKVKKSESRWWSPEMNLRIETENEKSMIYEVVGPNASTFTSAMFMILLGIVVFIAAFIMMLAQMQLGISSALASVGTALSGFLVIVSLSVLALGRMKATEQVARLREFAKTTLDT